MQKKFDLNIREKDADLAELDQKSKDAARSYEFTIDELEQQLNSSGGNLVELKV